MTEKKDDLEEELEKLLQEASMLDMGDGDIMENKNKDTMKDILESKTLKWIFVGGKGGVGKTTVSSSLAVLLAQYRKRVLLISTDPAHNLSDVFMEKFDAKARPTKAIPNLSVMEVDSKEMKKKVPFFDALMKQQEEAEKKKEKQEGEDKEGEQIEKEENEEEEEGEMLDSSNLKSKIGEMGGKLFEEIGSEIPGIDEITVFLEIMKEVKKIDGVDVIVFDTAPTGHTLRLLGLPKVIDNAYNKYFKYITKFSGMLNLPQNQIEESTKVINEIVEQFKNPDLTTFVCVSIPSFLSIFETERLVQELIKDEIDTSHIVINQILVPDDNCKLCKARYNIQQKYIKQFEELYGDFNIMQLPLFPIEVKQVKNLKKLHPFFLNQKQIKSYKNDAFADI